MKKSALTQRMKENYEMRARSYLTRRTPVIIRLDGCHFHTFTKGFNKPFDKILNKTMQDTAEYLCKNIQGCKYAYTQSDEISLLLIDYDTFDTDAWFDYQIQKICSVSASLATLAFNKFYSENIAEYTDSTDEFKKYAKKISTAYFDSRCFNIPKEEVVNYFVDREKDAIRNSKASLAQSKFSQKELMNKSADEMIEMVKTKFGIDWNDFNGEQKWGTHIYKVDSSIVGRKVWLADTNPTQFIDKSKREEIEKLLEVNL
jgi:tRNA(His) 5'-end guanylyltransferase